MNTSEGQIIALWTLGVDYSAGGVIPRLVVR